MNKQKCDKLVEELMSMTLNEAINLEIDPQGWKVLECGVTCTIGIRLDGTLWAWGNNKLGRTGIGKSQGFLREPTQIGTDSDWVSVINDHSAVIALKSDGTLWSWGSNKYGQTTHGELDSCTLSPKQIGTDSDWASFECENRMVAAIKKDGRLWVWGTNNGGRTGEYSNVTRTLKPKQIAGGGWSEVKIEDEYCVAWKEDDSKWLWGTIYADDEEFTYLEPVKVKRVKKGSAKNESR